MQIGGKREEAAATVAHAIHKYAHERTHAAWSGDSIDTPRGEVRGERMKIRKEAPP